MSYGFAPMKKIPKTNFLPWLTSVVFFVLSLALLAISSFYDLNVSSSFYMKAGDFGPWLAAIAPLPAYFLLAISGHLVFFIDNENSSKKRKIVSESLFFFFAIASGLLYGYFSLSPLLPLHFALPIGTFLMVGLACVYVYFDALQEKETHRNIGIIVIVSFLLIFLVFVLLDECLVRPSYKAILEKEEDTSIFLDWWVFQGQDAEYLKKIALEKSFLHGGPSLITALSPLTAFLPFVFSEKVRQKAWIGSLCSSLFILLAIFAELSAGTYFLSAIAWGLLIGTFVASSLLFSFNLLPSPDTRKRKSSQKALFSYKDNENAASRALRLNKLTSLRRNRARKKKRNKESFSPTGDNDADHHRRIAHG